jgi:putative membrane protein
MKTLGGWLRRDTVHLLRAALLFGFAALIAKLFIAGEMVKYMAPALDPLTALTGVVLAAMGVMEVAEGSRHAHDDEHRADAIEQTLTYLLVVLPLGLGILVTPRALGAGALGGESVASLLLAYAPGSAPSPVAEPPAPLKPIADTAEILAYLQQAGVSGVGQRVRATGLALRSEALGEGEFALLRYSVAHCVADARPVALLVVASGDPAVAVDQWVEVDGVLGVREREGNGLVSIVAERVRPIAEPQNPYLSSSF